MSERLYKNIIQGLQEARQHLRGEITLRVTTLTRDEIAAPPSADLETAWYSVNGDGDALTSQLRRESVPDHPLANVPNLTPIMRRYDRDEVVFRIENAQSKPFARVHLTYDAPRSPVFPVTEFFDTLEAATAPNR